MESVRNKRKVKDAPVMLLRPVGVVRSPVKNPSLVAESGDLERQAEAVNARDERSTISKIVIDRSLGGIVDGIEDFSHLLVLYWAHFVPNQRGSLIKVHPMGRKDFPLVGIFATRSPARPNPICVTAVRLLKHRGNTLTVEGLDAVDGSPLIDIKPYNPHYDTVGGVKLADWMVRGQQELAEAHNDRKRLAASQGGT